VWEDEEVLSPADSTGEIPTRGECGADYERAGIEHREELALSALYDHKDDYRHAGQNCADWSFGEHGEAERDRKQVKCAQVGFEARLAAGRIRIAWEPP